MSSSVSSSLLELTRPSESSACLRVPRSRPLQGEPLSAAAEAVRMRETDEPDTAVFSSNLLSGPSVASRAPDNVADAEEPAMAVAIAAIVGGVCGGSAAPARAARQAAHVHGSSVPAMFKR